MIQTAIPSEAATAILLRRAVLDAEGRPVNDNVPDPDVWEMVDAATPTLVRLGRGNVLITNGDDSEFVKTALLSNHYDNDNVVRAVFTPDSGCPAPAMCDILAVLVSEDSSLALCFEVLVGHDDVPELLTTPGELSMALLLDLSVLGVPMESVEATS